ncbi:MAG: hypothetical protein D6730_05820 [Bacteroidetes bacterium]|nr:MAG: hypothetical protein D6730_05820 [Bacteroidota bacterium]
MKWGMILWSCWLLWVNGWPVYAQEGKVYACHQRQLDSLVTVLEGRLAARLPAVRCAPWLDANARFERDTIWVGQVQAAYGSPGDLLSILYHEYTHYLLAGEKRYPVCVDGEGRIVQWDTGRMYVYEPDSVEVAEQIAYIVQHVLPEYGPLSEAEKRAHISRLRRDLSRPRELPFIYAPSNLALEEIAAYQAQLAGAQLGLYQLSVPARNAIARRLRQLADTYERRRQYEEQQHLGPDGCRQPARH